MPIPLNTKFWCEGEERNEAIRGRNTYKISYTFTLPNCKSVHRNTKKVGDATFLKADGNQKRRSDISHSFPTSIPWKRILNLGLVN